MTTIITKNGSGAPTAGQLSQGELAVDLTNKELYTKDSGGNVIKVGAQGGSTGTFTDLTATSSFTSPGIDDNATSTAITIDASENVGIGETALNAKLVIKNDANDEYAIRAGNAAGNSGSVAGITKIGLDAGTSGSTHAGAYVGLEQSNVSGYQSDLTFATRRTNADVAPTEAMRIDSAGNVGIGTDAPGEKLSVWGDGTATSLYVYDGTGSTAGRLTADGDEIDVSARGSANSRLTFTTGAGAGSEAMRIDASGNVGIGTDAPSSVLHLSTSNDPQITLTDTGFGASADITGSNGNLRLNSQTATIFDLADSEVMRIASSGNVGIGASAPRGQLHVEGGASGCPDTSGSANDLILEGSGNTGITVQTPNTGKASLFFQDPQSVSAGYVQYDHPSDSLRIGSAGAERMRIDSAGNVGIGGSPTSPLHVFGDAKLEEASPTLTLTDTSDGSSHLIQSVNSALNVQGAGQVRFSTAATERMRLDSTGNLLVGKTASAVAQPGVEIRNTDDVFSSVNNSQNTYHVYDTTAQGFTFYVSATGTINAVNTTITALSDERLKENVRDLDDGLSKVMALQPRKFDWKAGKGRDISGDRGFIAQEFETVFPDMVNSDGLNKDSDGESYKTICANLIPTLVKSIQEQQAMIKTLQAEVAALKGA